MGMFDYVRSDIPLPDGWEGECQSKDFDCCMTTIRISAEGRLLIERYETYTAPKEERPYPDEPDDSIMSLCGIWGKRNRHWEDLNYHGDFYFGGLEDLKDDYWHEVPSHPNGGWVQKRYRGHDYVARFTNGQLEYIRDENAADAPDIHP
jgi:hypothetical protein